MWPALPNRHSLRMQEEIQARRNQPLTEPEIKQMAGDFGLTLQTMQELARTNGFNPNATGKAASALAEAVREVGR